MSITLKRSNFYPEAITFPASKGAGAVTLSSDVYHDFRDGALASAEISLTAVDPTDITGAITVQPYASFDDGATWIKAYTGANITTLQSSAGTAEVTTIVFTGNSKAAYEGKWFVLYDGVDPYFCWFDHDGAETRPVSGVAAYDAAPEIKILASTAGTDNLAGVGATMETAIDLKTGVFTSVFNTATLTVTNVVKRACTNAYAGNLGTATSVLTSFKTTTNGVDCATVTEVLLAPTFKMTATIGELAAGHGIKANLRMKELDIDYRKKIYPNVIAIPDVVTAGGLIEFYSAPMYSTANLDPIKKVLIAISSEDLADVTNTWNVILQTSDDQVNWVTASATIASLANGTNSLYDVDEIVSGTTYFLGKYVRIKLVANADAAAFATGHGSQINVVLSY